MIREYKPDPAMRTVRLENTEIEMVVDAITDMEFQARDDGDHELGDLHAARAAELAQAIDDMMPTGEPIRLKPVALHAFEIEMLARAVADLADRALRTGNLVGTDGCAKRAAELREAGR